MVTVLCFKFFINSLLNSLGQRFCISSLTCSGHSPVSILYSMVLANFIIVIACFIRLTLFIRCGPVSIGTRGSTPLLAKSSSSKSLMLSNELTTASFLIPAVPNSFHPPDFTFPPYAYMISSLLPSSIPFIRPCCIYSGMCVSGESHASTFLFAIL